MAERKTTRKKTTTNHARATKTGAAKKQTGNKQERTRFGDSILDEVILIVVILFCVLLAAAQFTDKLGIFGAALAGFSKGIFGFAGLLLPFVVICFCVWMLASETKKAVAVRICGGVLFLLTVASLAAIINPVRLAEGSGFLQTLSAYYKEGSFANGGVLGGLVGSGLYALLDTLGSILVLLACLIISLIMATGKSFFHAIVALWDRKKARQKLKNEKIKNKADRIRQMEQIEEERQQKKRPKQKEDYNIRLSEETKEAPYVEETVFRKKDSRSVLKKREPIYDYIKENEQESMAQEKQTETHFAEPSVQPVKKEDEAEDVIERIFAMPKEEEAPSVEESAFSATEEELFPEEAQEQTYAAQENAEEAQPEKQEVPMQTEDTAVTQDASAAQEEAPYVFPPISLLGKDPGRQGGSKMEALENARRLEATLKSFGVEAKVIQVNQGPTVTRYELSPSQGVKVSKIVNLSDDIALNLAASGIRIEAPIPGKAAVGIEVPNKETRSVFLRTVLESDVFVKFPSHLAFALGEDIAGNAVVTDIAKMPHLLIAGATGSGKSVCINTLIVSILYKAEPKDVKLLLIDPKVVELSVYNGIPHLLIPVVTDPKKAASALHWAVREMLQRYNDFAAAGVRDIKGFNAWKESIGEADAKMPQIVIIIDELADLMMAAPGEVEDSICRLAQMARAAGMHLIIATQRPSVDVITGVIKANIPSRLAFAVSSGIDSRTILDMVGAEKLVGKGDMLFSPAGQSKPSRIQGAFVTDKEVEQIVDFLKKSSRPTYTQEMVDTITTAVESGSSQAKEDEDEFFQDAVRLVLEKEKGSASMLQRHFRVGYNRAANMIEEMERRGIVGPDEGSKPRKVLISAAQWEEMNQGTSPLSDEP